MARCAIRKCKADIFPAARNGETERKTAVLAAGGAYGAVSSLPYDMYRVTGNELVLRENYEAMKKWAAYIERTAAEKRGDTALPEEIDRYLWNTGFHFGEWLIPSRPHDDPKRPYYRCPETAYFTAPFFGYMTIRKMAEISRILGYDEDSAAYELIGRLFGLLEYQNRNQIIQMGTM